MSFIQQLITFFFPPLCVHCHREGAWLCPEAAAMLAQEQPIVNPLRIRGVDRVIVRGSYDCLPLQGLVTKLKYNFWSGVHENFPDVLDPLVKQLPKHRDVVIVPVPLHTRRQRERGFNQSVYVARQLSHLTGYPMSPLLQRVRYTTPQAQLTEAKRKTNIIDAFVVQRNITSVPHSVILVDDVITTGSTVAECASVLRQHGVKNITAVALAKG